MNEEVSVWEHFFLNCPVIFNHIESKCVIRLGEDFSLEGHQNYIQFTQTSKHSLMLLSFNSITWGRKQYTSTGAMFYNSNTSTHSPVPLS